MHTHAHTLHTLRTREHGIRRDALTCLRVRHVYVCHHSLKAGESKGGGNAYPLVKNLVEGSIAHNNEEFTIGNSISAVNGVRSATP